MKRVQQGFLIINAIIAFGGSAGADRTQVAAVTTPNTERLETAGVPPECDQFRTVPPDSRSATLPWEQRLSLASCRESFDVQPVTNAADLPTVVQQIDQSMRPSIAVYQDAIARGPTPQIQMLAAYHLALTNVDIMVRTRNAIPLSTSGLSLDAFTQLHQQVEPLLVQYRDAAVQAFQRVAQLAEANPTAANGNAVISFIERDARTQLGVLQPQG